MKNVGERYIFADVLKFDQLIRGLGGFGYAKKRQWKLKSGKFKVGRTRRIRLKLSCVLLSFIDSMKFEFEKVPDRLKHEIGGI
jgi:hypothetical protein